MKRYLVTVTVEFEDDCPKVMTWIVDAERFGRAEQKMGLRAGDIVESIAKRDLEGVTAYWTEAAPAHAREIVDLIKTIGGTQDTEIGEGSGIAPIPENCLAHITTMIDFEFIRCNNT